MIKTRSQIVCEQCGKFISKSNYKKHLRRHINHPETFLDSKYKINHDGLICQYCGKECKNKKSLCNHERLCKENPNRQIIKNFNVDVKPRIGFNDAGREAWNKGLTKDTDNRIAAAALKISQSTKGKSKNYTEEQNCIRAKKMTNTKMGNGTLNSSKAEDIILSKLILKYGVDNVKHHYTDNRYPYECDFYIVDEDIFIEINFHWTHGGKPYDPNDVICQRQLENWKKKSTTSKYFLNAIDTWTRRDVNKLETALHNNLKYIVIYDFTDLVILGIDIN